MDIMLTFNNLFRIGIMGIFLIIALICIIIAVIDVFTKNWRYKHFKCPKCGHMKSNGKCGHWRNDKCDCDYFYKGVNK